MNTEKKSMLPACPERNGGDRGFPAKLVAAWLLALAAWAWAYSLLPPGTGIISAVLAGVSVVLAMLQCAEAEF